MAFRSDCGPAAWSAECLEDSAQGDQELGRGNGCWEQQRALPHGTLCLPCPESAQVQVSPQPAELPPTSLYLQSVSQGLMGPLSLPSCEDSLLGEGPLERPGARLCLSDGPLRTAARRRYGKKPGLEDTAHIFIASECHPGQPGHGVCRPCLECSLPAGSLVRHPLMWPS